MGLAFSTAGQLVNQAARELGLIPAALADPYASTDPNIQLLTALLDSLGRDLVGERYWSTLQQPYTFSTVANQGQYALPPDFDRLIPQTAWNRTNRLPMGGPLSPQDWQQFKGMSVGALFIMLDRVLQGQFQVYPDVGTPGGFVVAYEYITRYWVRSAAQQAVYAAAAFRGQWNNGVTYKGPYTGPPGPGSSGDIVMNAGGLYTENTVSAQGIHFAALSGNAGPVGTTAAIADATLQWGYTSASGLEAPTALDDQVLFDTMLMREGLKLKFRQEKGLAWDDANYKSALEKAQNKDAEAPILSLKTGSSGPLLIGPQSLPWTGFGGR